MAIKRAKTSFSSSHHYANMARLAQSIERMSSVVEQQSATMTTN